MTPRYIDAVLEGGLVPDAHVKIRADSGPLLTLDGCQGYGQVIGAEAMALGIERAKAHGVCVVGLAHSHHLGRIGHWAEQCIAAGLVSIHFVNVLSRPIVAPFGGRDARIGTNPFCVGIPRPGKEPIVLDFATSKIAQGKTRVAFNKGMELEPGTIIDDRGEPTTEPALYRDRAARRAAAVRRAQGLGPGPDLRAARRRARRRRHRRPGDRRSAPGPQQHVLGHRRRRPARHGRQPGCRRWSRSSPGAPPRRPLPGCERVLTPGEPERATKAARLADGVPVDSVTWDEIVAAGGKVGLAAGDIEALSRRR